MVWLFGFFESQWFFKKRRTLSHMHRLQGEYCKNPFLPQISMFLEVRVIPPIISWQKHLLALYMIGNHYVFSEVRVIPPIKHYNPNYNWDSFATVG